MSIIEILVYILFSPIYLINWLFDSLIQIIFIHPFLFIGLFLSIWIFVVGGDLMSIIFLLMLLAPILFPIISGMFMVIVTILIGIAEYLLNVKLW